MRLLLAIVLISAPAAVEAQTFGGWKWLKKEARTEREAAVAAAVVHANPPAPPTPATTADTVARAAITARAETAARAAIAADADADADESRPKWAEAFSASVASDRISVTTSVVAIPLACAQCVFRVMGNEVKAQVEGATPEIRDQLRQRVTDLQSLIDNGGSYAIHFAREGGFKSESGRFQGFAQTHAGFGKLSAATDESDNRYAANLALELVGKLDLGRVEETLEIIVGGRTSGIRALSGSLLSGLDEKTLGVYQLFGLVKVHGTTALTFSWTSVPSQQEYAPRFMIGFNVLKP